MELKDLQITDDLWDFIEANVPNYHEREEVLRQAQLQLFIDGHESPVAGITREEAILLRNNILHGLFAEAVAAFTRRTPEQKALEAKLRYDIRQRRAAGTVRRNSDQRNDDRHGALSQGRPQRHRRLYGAGLRCAADEHLRLVDLVACGESAEQSITTYL